MVRLNKLIMIPTPKQGYRNVYQRSFDVHATQQDISAIENIMHSNCMNMGLSEIPTSVVANNLSNVVKLAKFPQKRHVNIENGWGTQRFRFLLETEEIVNGQSILGYIQGYTSHAEVSYSGIMDPNMVFYINSIYVMRKHMTPTGGLVVTPSHEFNVVHNHTGATYEYNELDNGQNRLIRPKDIVEDIGLGVQYGNNYDIVNTTGNIDLNTASSDRANNSGIHYLTKTLNGYLVGKSLAGISHDDRDILRNAGEQLNEKSISTVAFIKEIFRLTSVPQATSFDLGLLEVMDSTLGTRTTVLNPNTTDATMTHTAAPTMLDTIDTEDTLNPTVETMKVAEFMFGVSSIMADNMLTNLSFSFTNETGVSVFVPLNANSLIDGLDVTYFLDKAKNQILFLLGPVLTDNNQTLVTVHADISLVGDSSIGIEVNGAPAVIYRYPLFCDSLFIPVVTDVATKDDISGQFQMLFDATSGINGSEFKVNFNY